jgi:hypothetical protein
MEVVDLGRKKYSLLKRDLAEGKLVNYIIDLSFLPPSNILLVSSTGWNK